MSDITQILAKIDEGDPLAADQLLPLVYDELRKLAATRMKSEKPGQTLQATALVHDAYLRLVASDEDKNWDSRGHFFSAAAEAMRRILVDSARRKGRIRHGGEFARVELHDWIPAIDSDPDELLDLDEAINRFSKIDPQTTKLVKLRLFAGLSNDEAAAALKIPSSTAKKHWLFARSWLRREMGERGD